MFMSNGVAKCLEKQSTGRGTFSSQLKSSSKEREAVGKFEEYSQPQIMQILKNRREFGRTDVTYLMDLLEPNNRGQYLSQLEVQAATDLLANKISKNPAFITRENEIMIELAKWRGRTGKLEVEMASKLTFTKQNLMLEHADLFNKSSRRDASVEEEEFGAEELEENANEDLKTKFSKRMD
uniref:Uncharacterized protein n=1 Tax=Ditylenchus dipsaci TaxID=166011 RepID=A0A915EAQ0_9BILA